MLRYYICGDCGTPLRYAGEAHQCYSFPSYESHPSLPTGHGYVPTPAELMNQAASLPLSSNPQGGYMPYRPPFSPLPYEEAFRGSGMVQPNPAYCQNPQVHQPDYPCTPSNQWAPGMNPSGGCSGFSSLSSGSSQPVEGYSGGPGWLSWLIQSCQTAQRRLILQNLAQTLFTNIPVDTSPVDYTNAHKEIAAYGLWLFNEMNQPERIIPGCMQPIPQTDVHNQLSQNGIYIIVVFKAENTPAFHILLLGTVDSDVLQLIVDQTLIEFSSRFLNAVFRVMARFGECSYYTFNGEWDNDKKESQE